MRLRPRDPSWILTLLAVGGALAVTVVLTGTRLLVPSEQAVIRSSVWAWTHDGVAVEPVDPDGPFRAGDVVVAMNGVPLETWAADAFRLPWVAPTTPPDAAPDRRGVVRFDVRRDGRLLSIEAPRQTLSPDRAGGAPIGVVAFGVGVLALALVLVVRRPRLTALRLLLVAAAANMSDIVAWELDLQPTDLAVQTPYLAAFCAAAGFNLIFWSSIAHILTIYPVRSQLARSRFAIPAIYAAPIAALAVGLVVARLVGGSVTDWIGRWATVQALVASAMLVVIMAATVAGYRRTREPRRRQVRWIALALGVAATATMGLLTLPIVLIGHPLVSRNTVDLLVLPVPIALALAVIRDRLFQVDLLARSRGRIVAAREEERRRLRRDLHDGLGPTLAAIGLKLDLAREQEASDSSGLGPLLDEIRADVRSVISDVRRIARELRPPTLDSLGLAGAIGQQAAALGGGGSGPSIVVEVDEQLPALPAAVEVIAYRIATEAMTNVVRHSEARSCLVRLYVDRDGLVVEVADDGRGIDPSAATGVGLRSIDERASEVGGEVDLLTRPGGGTIVRARLPLTDDDRDGRATEES